MAHCLGFSAPSFRFRHLNTISIQVNKSKLSIRSSLPQPQPQPQGNAHKLVAQVKEKLKEHSALPLGKNGRDDEEMILWYLKDTNYSVKDTVSKLTKAIRWRHEFGVSELSEETMKNGAETGKFYVHEYLDVYGRPVLIANLSKHIPGEQEIYEDEKLCVYMIEKAMSKLTNGKEQILALIDFRGFDNQNVDIKLLPFIFETLYYYYPRRLGEVLFVDTPFMYIPIWKLVKPFLKSYGDMVKFRSGKIVEEQYFTSNTVPATFRSSNFY